MTGNGKVRKLSSEYINNIFEGMNVNPLLKKLKEVKKKIGNSENDDRSSVNEGEWIAHGLRKENTKSDDGASDIINLDSTPVSTSSDQSSSISSPMSSSSSSSSPTSTTQDTAEATTPYRSEE